MLAEVSVKVLMKVLAILSKKSVDGSIDKTSLMKYWCGQYFLKVLLITLMVYVFSIKFKLLFWIQNSSLLDITAVYMHNGHSSCCNHTLAI